MPELRNSGHETIAQEYFWRRLLSDVADWGTCARVAGYSPRNGRTIGSALGQRTDVSQRIAELRERARTLLSRDPEFRRLLHAHEARQRGDIDGGNCAA